MRGFPDPRRYGSGGHAWLALPQEHLREALRAALADGRDGDVKAALSAAASRERYAEVWRLTCDVAHRRAGSGDDLAVLLRVFAIPLVIVTGSRTPAEIAGVLPDIAAVGRLFERCAGPTRNFGFSNALVNEEALAGVLPSEVYAWSAALGATPRELPPAPIAITQPGEQAHLRFLVGAGVSRADEPSFVETAGDIGAWGMPLVRELSRQLATPGVDILPMPRPPLDLLRAAHAGRAARLEVALQLFASNTLRRLRNSAGEPVAVLSAHDDGDIRLSLSAPLGDGSVCGFRWPMHPLDDVGSVIAIMARLLEECRVIEVRCMKQVLPARKAAGEIWLPPATG